MTTGQAAAASNGIVWLASYPKSGNTWLRVLLTNYLRDGEVPADINALAGGPIASARMWFDEWVGVAASSLDDDTIESLRPGVYRCLAGDVDDTLFMKVHDAWTVTPAGEQMFPADVTRGVVYVVRNPLDMVASVANHYGLTLEGAVDQLCDPGFLMASRDDRLDNQLRQRMGTWDDHVRSWVEDSGLPVHVVRYEDMKADTVAALRGVIEFAGLEVDAARLAKAGAFSEFTKLQEQEATTGFHEKPVKTEAFFRRGDVDGWREELAPELAERITTTFAATMRRLGYADPGGDATKPMGSRRSADV